MNSSAKRPTPRTDAIEHPFRPTNDPTYLQMLNHAHDLERELAVAQERISQWHHDGPCCWCGEPTNSLAADPGQWAVLIAHEDDPGRVKPHHYRCLYERLHRLVQAEAEIQKVRDFITDNSDLGSGDQPVDFILASHQFLAAKLKTSDAIREEAMATVASASAEITVVTEHIAGMQVRIDLLNGELRELRAKGTQMFGEQMELTNAIRELSMAMGCPAVQCKGEQTLESQTVRLAAERLRAASVGGSSS